MKQIAPIWIRTSKKSTEDNLIPLINIVFLLLIFFMVAGKIQQPLVSDPQLPKTPENPERQKNQNSIQLELTAEAIYINGEITNQQDLLQHLELLPDDKQIFLHADKQLATIHLNSFLTTLRKSGHKSFEIVTQIKQVSP